MFASSTVNQDLARPPSKRLLSSTTDGSVEDALCRRRICDGALKRLRANPVQKRDFMSTARTRGIFITRGDR